MKFQPALFILSFEIAAMAITLWDLFRMGIQVVRVGWTGWVHILISLGAKWRRSNDVTYLGLVPSLQTQRNIFILNNLGFHRIGEAQVKMPFRPAGSGTVWVLSDAEGKVQAEANYRRVSFSSFFQEKGLVVTDFPSGEHIDTPMYQSRTITTSLPEAYQYHLQQVEKFSRSYGTPHLIRNMSAYLHWETVGRLNYGLRKLNRFVWINVFRLAACVYACLVLILTPLWFHPARIPALARLSWTSPLEILLFAMTVLTAPALIAARVYLRNRLREMRRDSRRKGLPA